MSDPRPLSPEWVRRVRDEHYEATKHMTLEEIAAQSQRAAEELLQKRGLKIDPETGRLVPLAPISKAVSKKKKSRASQTEPIAKPRTESKPRRKTA